jgi:hypothetical protein
MRSILLNDPDFERLHGLQEDTESMHNEYKWRATARFAGFRWRGRGSGGVEGARARPASRKTVHAELIGLLGGETLKITYASQPPRN